MNTAAFELAFEGRKNSHRGNNQLSLEKQLSLYPHEKYLWVQVTVGDCLSGV